MTSVGKPLGEMTLEGLSLLEKLAGLRKKDIGQRK